jgi:hypothetical protein
MCQILTFGWPWGFRNHVSDMLMLKAVSVEYIPEVTDDTRKQHFCKTQKSICQNTIFLHKLIFAKYLSRDWQEAQADIFS